jgi:hypothetical protein
MKQESINSNTGVRTLNTVKNSSETVYETAEPGVGSIPLSRIQISDLNPRDKYEGDVDEKNGAQDMSFKLTGNHVIHLKGSWFIGNPSALKSLVTGYADVINGICLVADMVDGQVLLVKCYRSERNPQDAFWLQVGETVASLMCEVAKAIREESHSFIKGRSDGSNPALESALGRYKEYIEAVERRLPLGNKHALCLHDSTEFVLFAVEQARACIHKMWAMLCKLDDNGQAGVDAIDEYAEWVGGTMTQMFRDVAKRSNEIPSAHEQARVMKLETAYELVPG